MGPRHSLPPITPTHPPHAHMYHLPPQVYTPHVPSDIGYPRMLQKPQMDTASLYACARLWAPCTIFKHIHVVSGSGKLCGRFRHVSVSRVSVAFPSTFPLRSLQRFGQCFGQGSVSVNVSVTLRLRRCAPDGNYLGSPPAFPGHACPTSQRCHGCIPHPCQSTLLDTPIMPKACSVVHSPRSCAR